MLALGVELAVGGGAFARVYDSLRLLVLLRPGAFAHLSDSLRLLVLPRPDQMSC